MLRIPRIYLETTIFNFPFADDAPQYKADTLKLFAEIKAGKFMPFTSEYVKSELDGTKDTDKQAKMKAMISEYGITTIPICEETEKLAAIYVAEGIVPKKFETDALHIASATVAGMDIIVSLNFKHIVKYRTIIQVEAINAQQFKVTSRITRTARIIR